MESVYLKTFVEVVNTGSFSRAADTLFVTQPAVSRRIKFIEEQYGYLLLDRSGPTLVPTAAGKLVFEKATLMLNIERELISDLKADNDSENIAFVCTPTFGIVHLPTILSEFVKKYDHSARLTVMFDNPINILAAVRKGIYDLAVVYHCKGLGISDLNTIPLAHDELVFVSAPKLDIPAGRVDLDALLSEAFISSKEGSCPYTLLEGVLSERGKAISAIGSFIVIDDLKMIVQLVLDGRGVSLLSRELVRDKLEAGFLREHQIDGFKPFRTRTLILNRQVSPSADSPIAYLISSLKKQFEQGAAALQPALPPGRCAGQ